MKRILLYLTIILCVNNSLMSQARLWGGVTSSIDKNHTINQYNAVIQFSKFNIGFGYNRPTDTYHETYKNTPSVLVGYEALKHIVIYAEATRLKNEKYKFGLVIEGRINNIVSFHTGIQENKSILFGFRLCGFATDWF